MNDPMLVNAGQLAELLERDACLVFDCRFDLGDPDEGRRAYLAGHIPGARYADLNRDLSGEVTSRSGRHPLPNPQAFAAFLARSGWRPGIFVVAYDAQSGAFAARIWWLLKYHGQRGGALLDGGLQAWTEAGLPLESVEPAPADAAPAELEPRTPMVVSTAEVLSDLGTGRLRLIDARAADRFRGRNETIDSVAGHVPGACNLPFAGNLSEQGRFKTADELRARFRERLGDGEAGDVAHMCGSGVTACHNLFAMELAGLPGSRLYAGSWSEWITDPERPVSLGSE